MRVWSVYGSGAVQSSTAYYYLDGCIYTHRGNHFSLNLTDRRLVRWVVVYVYFQIP